jgi:hypothetical protein
MDTLKNFETQKGFEWLEADLAARFGCPVAQLVKWRGLELVEGKDWERIKRQVHYTASAVKKTALAVAGLREEDLPWLGHPRPPVPPVVTFKVYPMRTLNPHILLAQDGFVASGAPRLVRVRVKTKDNFRPGMEVRARHVGGDLYELVGHCPRFPGKY